MSTLSSQRQSASYSRLFIKGLIGLGLALVIGSLAFASARQMLVNAQGGVKGYVVGSQPVAAYACPDTKCAIKLTLPPGTEVLIVDNVVGAALPGTSDTAWRMIVAHGQTAFVPMRYISLNPHGNADSSGQDISFVQTSHEDNTGSPNASNPGTTSFSSSIAPPSSCSGICVLGGCPPGNICISGDITSGWTYIVCPTGAFLKCRFPVYQCPPGSMPDPANLSCTAPQKVVTWYTATDGRMNGNAGDRIAVYCRQTGRIEVWSINVSQGRFLVEFRHEAVDAAGSAGFHVTVGNQGVVTINGDGHGNYWASISGGPYHATGTGDFAKSFSCYVH